MPERGKVYDFFETFKGLEPGAWSPPSGVRLQRGRFTVDFRIKDHALRYEVRPRRSLDHVELRVTGAADSCRELKVLVDDRVHSEHELSPPGASGPSRSGGQVSQVALSAIEAQSQASSAAIQLCETTLPLSARKRQQLGGIAKASRSYGAKVGDR